MYNNLNTLKIHVIYVTIICIEVVYVKTTFEGAYTLDLYTEMYGKRVVRTWGTH